MNSPTTCGAVVLLVSIIVLQLATLVISQPPTAWTTWPFNPNSLPLAVKSPYLNAWAPLAGGSAALNSAWPRSYDPLGNVSHVCNSRNANGHTF